MEKSVLAEHHIKSGHQAWIKDITMLVKTSGFWGHIIGELIEIVLRSNVVNRDAGLHFGKV